MVNYLYLEFFRNKAGLSYTQISEVCGKTGGNARGFYSKALNNNTELSHEHLKAIAQALDIVPEWLTQSPVIIDKKSLDYYVEQYSISGEAALVNKTDKPNQYEIVTPISYGYLKEFSNQINSISQGLICSYYKPADKQAIEQYFSFLGHSFKPEQYYVEMPLRTMLAYAMSQYGSVASFVKAFALQYPDVITKSVEKGLITSLTTARHILNTSVSRRVMECFANFAEITIDQALCDFYISSDEAVFNLFLAVYISLSGWVVCEDEKTGSYILTLTDPMYLPNAKADRGINSSLNGMPIIDL